MNNGREDRIVQAIHELRASQNDMSRRLEDRIGQAVGDLLGGQAALQNDIDQLQADNDTLRQRVGELETKLDRMESDGRRTQIWIHGIPKPRGRETWEACEQTVRAFLSNRLNIGDNMVIERARRVGEAIAVKFLSLRDRDTVMSRGRYLKGTQISMRPDVSKSVRDKVRGLVSLKQSYKQDNKRASIRHDRLYTADGVFTYDLDSQCIVQLSGPAAASTAGAGGNAAAHHVNSDADPGEAAAIHSGCGDHSGRAPRGAGGGERQSASGPTTTTTPAPTAADRGASSRVDGGRRGGDDYSRGPRGRAGGQQLRQGELSAAAAPVLPAHPQGSPPRAVSDDVHDHLTGRAPRQAGGEQERRDNPTTADQRTPPAGVRGAAAHRCGDPSPRLRGFGRGQGRGTSPQQCPPPPS